MVSSTDSVHIFIFPCQVDTENETMRMREGWKVWLLPNQATGKQGVPRYIKVDPATDSATDPGEAAAASVVDATEPEVAAGEVICVRFKGAASHFWHQD